MTLIFGDVDSASEAPRAGIVAAILKDGNRVLLCHRSPGRRNYPNVWDLPGGHVEPAETLGQALVRELREELTILIEEPRTPPKAVIVTAEIRLHIWLIESWVGIVTNAAPDEHDALAWVDRMTSPTNGLC